MAETKPTETEPLKPAAPPPPTIPTTATSLPPAVTRPTASHDAARSVADAVKRVADAAVAEIEKHRAVEDEGDFNFVGSPGGTFSIVGPDNRSFSSSGTVLLNGAQLHATSWSAGRIEGRMPADARPGTVEVVISRDLRKRGYFRG